MTETRTYAVTGMSCGHCETAVREEVGELLGVSDIRVSQAEGSLTITTDDPELMDRAVVAAVDEAGYSAERSG